MNHHFINQYILYNTKTEKKATDLSFPDSQSFLSICSLSTLMIMSMMIIIMMKMINKMIITLLAFSRKRTRSRSWFSRIRRVSRDFLAARLFFLTKVSLLLLIDIYCITHLLLSQYLSSLAPAPGDGRQLTGSDRGMDREGTVIKLCIMS